MKTLPLLCTLTLLSAITAAAQTPATQRLDNFDLATGVKIQEPEPPPASVVQPKRGVRLTARTANASATEMAPAPRAEEIVSPPATQLPLRAASARTLDGFSTGSAFVDSLITESATRHDVDPLLIYSIMHQESTFKQRALSPKGARGLMQLMPATAARFGVRNIYDPRENIEGGTRYVRWLLNTFDGDVRLTLAGYNAGEGAVFKYGRCVPPYNETQNYVRRITARYALLRDPQSALRAPRVTPSQVAAIKKTEKPGAIYEQSVFIVRLPDGKARLVSQ